MLWPKEKFARRLSSANTSSFDDVWRLTSVATKSASPTPSVNDGFDRTPHMFLYHCNLGWQLLDEGAEFQAQHFHRDHLVQ